jgi:hypothetical protein
MDSAAIEDSRVQCIEIINELSGESILQFHKPKLEVILNYLQVSQKDSQQDLKEAKNRSV